MFGKSGRVINRSVMVRLLLTGSEYTGIGHDHAKADCHELPGDVAKAFYGNVFHDDRLFVVITCVRRAN
jgi:hypothetical protein